MGSQGLKGHVVSALVKNVLCFKTWTIQILCLKFLNFKLFIFLFFVRSRNLKFEQYLKKVVFKPSYKLRRTMPRGVKMTCFDQADTSEVKKTFENSRIPRILSL